VVKHICWPNAIGTIIVQATFAVADAIPPLSVLCFLDAEAWRPRDPTGFDAFPSA